MENKDQPINPINEAEKDRLDNYPYISYTGLTKREYFAGLAMQGLASQTISNNPYDDSLMDIVVADCKLSIMYADELLKQLETK